MTGCLFLPFGLKVGDGVVGQDFRPVFPSLPETAESWIGRIPEVGLSCNRAMITNGVFFVAATIVRHPGTDMGDVIEEFVGVDADMPFSSEIGLVTQPAHAAPPVAVVEWFLLGRTLFLDLVDSLLNGVGVPKGFSGVEHGSGGNADRPRPGPHVKALSKLGSLTCQAIEIRSEDGRIIVGAERVVGLIIRENEENIGGRIGRSEGGRREQGQEAERQDRTEGAFPTKHGRSLGDQERIGTANL